MVQFRVSAPGKIILYGEHAVVYGKTALAASLNLRTTLDYQDLAESEETVRISLAKVDLVASVPLEQIRKELFDVGRQPGADWEDNHDDLYCSVQKLVNAIGYSNSQQRLSLEAFFYSLVYVSRKEGIALKPFRVSLTSELTVSAGLGSSASYAVCLAACFLHLSRARRGERTLLDETDLLAISKYAFRCERIMHGTPSGIDNSVCTFGSVVEFKKDAYVRPVSVARSMKILLVDTRVQRSTKTIVEALAALHRRYPAIVGPILDSIDSISREALRVIKDIRDTAESGDSLAASYAQLMTLIGMNQGLLATLTMSHPSLDRICAEAHNYALAGKLTGAGRGGYAYILLYPDTQPETISSISRKLIADGFSVTLTSLGCSGVEIRQ